MLLEDAALADWDEMPRNNLECILKNGEHLLVLINDVLDLSKIAAGWMIVKYSQVDVNALLASVVEEIRSLAITCNLVLRTETVEDIGYLETNTMKLRQILLNLLSNAIKFTEQGEVTLSATRGFFLPDETECIAFAVKDTGMEIIPSFQLLWKATRQTFTLHLPEPTLIVFGDAIRVTQILTNLLSNAHKYTPDEGHIDLSVQAIGSFACTAVTDTGIGLCVEEQARIFTRFYRAHNSTTRAIGGTGLGLAITRMLVEMQGGEIQVLSEPGHGSTFSFTLPLAE